MAQRERVAFKGGDINECSAVVKAIILWILMKGEEGGMLTLRRKSGERE